MASTQKNDPRGVLIVDLGAQYAQLIARRVREAGTWCEIAPPHKALEAARRMNLAGVILSGGPASVYAADAPKVPRELLDLGVPVLGICYGMQWMSQQLGGEVLPAAEREFGRTSIAIARPEGLLEAIEGRTVVWMSHGDKVERLPAGFEVYASSDNCPFAVVGDTRRRFYGVQFHPEVSHTLRGAEILTNFLARVCELPLDWKPGGIVEREVAKIREAVGNDGEVVLGLSGGVDSSVAALLLHQAIGPRLHSIFVDNGLLRMGERDVVESTFREHFKLDLTVVDASERFLGSLAGVTDPEKKRKLIGRDFVDVFQKEAKRFAKATFLAQGTLYPDVIESVNVHGGNTAVIKSHHNVGGLPDTLHMQLVEPLRELFKDEVRAIGRHLGLDPRIVGRQPFPGPGLAVRIVGEVTRERCDLLRRADHIVTSEVEAAGAHTGLWQYFAVLLPVKSVGVMGDARTYENCCAVRAVESQDGMTADWAYLDQELLRRISNRIINEVRGINRVVLDISSKPPATIEWGMKRISLTQWILIAMAAGVLVGWLWPGFAKELGPLSTIFLRLIKLIIAPLVFSTLVVGIAGHGDDLKQLGRLALKSLVYFEVVTTVALAIGLLAGHLVRPGEGVQLPPAGSGSAAQTLAQAQPTLESVIKHIVPESFFEAAAKNEVLQVVFFAVLFALGLMRVRGRPKAAVLEFCEGVSLTMFKVTGIVMYFAPIGVGAAIAVTVGQGGVSQLKGLALLVLTLYGALAVFALVALLPIALWIRLPLRHFLRLVKEPALIAFATTSSEAALPKALENMERLGVPRRIVAFVLPTGYSFNLDGSTLYLSLAALFVAQAAGIELSLGNELLLMLTLMVTSKGVAAVPRASLVILSGSLLQFGLPLEGVAVILAVDSLMDMARTSTNLVGNCLATAVMARWEGEFGEVLARARE